ncbi:hypothetical protein PT974_05476 [Cladobotryum mycophilum]|uniref:F-box domain-containing protein n=1 Tax=Cladobotryum mycophilum TaxID=491253 RepID=A0ABR0SIT0_9HYPO
MEQSEHDTPLQPHYDNAFKSTNTTIYAPSNIPEGVATGRDTYRSQGIAKSELGSAEDEDEPAASSQRLFETETSSSSSRLENLPAELRLKLLMHMPDLRTLRSLVHASPIIHAQYRYNRNTVLRMCVGCQLDGCLVDAYATLKSRVREIGSPRTDEKITDFLSSYQSWLSDSVHSSDVNSIHPGSLRWLAAYHLAVAQPLLHSYSKWALTNLSKATSSSTNEQVATEFNVKLQRSEEIRILRALYRYETFCHLFGRNQGRRHGAFRHNEVNEIFFCLFDPWEAEAIGCVDLFVRDKYQDIFDEVKGDLDPKNPRFRLENGVFHPEGSFDLHLEYEDYMDGTVSCGLTMTVRLLAVNDHEKLVAKMQRCLTHDACLDASMMKTLGSGAQNDRREMSPNFPNSRDEAEERRDPIDFVSDAVPPYGPPLAWVLLWNGKYANIYGDYVPESLRRWGYVMWNESRWTEMGARELIKMQWETAPDLVREIEFDYDWSPVGHLATEN